MLSRSITRFRSNIVMTTKRYASNESTTSAGATASSKTFSDKEKAAENQWARAHDKEKLKLLREELNKQKKATEDLEKKVNELSGKH
ncbi:uncharacterized protein BX664DRAFT_360200 [Halteromyces radiatus]|uniref:uncharacterized protein n=1 Tax=Halteromyces radiatus TaxID=101107 RepID=UPI00221FAA57|nr:uncharacterized protein BX664DRAFT_360200 [Halteromyces radiatus]KAI8086696.1 hypothetical protein BX664DRAFT_360200 [Halteromyces radiatus]